MRLFGRKPKEPLFLLVELLGFEPHDPELYDLAFRHSSVSKTDKEGFKLNNERLEFLGDSVLATAMSHYLYQRHPHWNEGEMSKRRGAIVGRKVNNAVAQRMGLDRLLQIRREARQGSTDIYGNTLEALIGAIFLDQAMPVLKLSSTSVWYPSLWSLREAYESRRRTISRCS